jgi:hypothetical protein
MGGLLAWALVGLALGGVDVSGRWRGSIAIDEPAGLHYVPAYVELKQKGGTVTGVAGEDERSAGPMSAVRLEGGRLTFRLHNPGTSKMQFDLVIKGGEMSGTVLCTRPASRRQRAKVTLKRQD